MKGTACLFSPATALSQVFLAGLRQRPVDLAIVHGPSALLAVPQFLAPYRNVATTPRATTAAAAQWTGSSHLYQRRYLHFSATPARRAPAIRRSGGGGGGGANRGNNVHAKFKLGRFPRDDEIRERYVILRQEDGSLSDPQQTRHVLGSINRRVESLVVLAMPRSAEPQEEGAEEKTMADASDATPPPSQSAGPRYPICKIIDRVAERKADAEKAKLLRRKNARGKEVELNWAIDTHDLNHRLDKLREFLEKGMTVEVRLMRKGRGKARATRDEAAELLRRVRETVTEVPGAKETKPIEGELLRLMKLFLEGPAKKD